MRSFGIYGFGFIIIASAGLVSGQGLTEFGAAAAGSTVGAASGRAVSTGIDHIFGRVGGALNQAAGDKKDAKATKNDPALKVAPGVPKPAAEAEAPDTSGVPAPLDDRPSRTPVRKAPVATQAQIEVPVAPATPPPPPPPTMTPDDLKQVTPGMARADVLKLGVPASKITSFEDGHLSEVYSYRANGERFGTVKLQDGSVASVQGQ